MSASGLPCPILVPVTTTEQAPTPLPVTVSTARRAVPGQESVVAAWLRTGSALVEEFPGCLGAGWLRPPAGDDTWHAVYRFVDADALRAWELSPQRAWWLSSAQGLVEDTETVRRTGVEGWFDTPVQLEVERRGTPPPPRWKQAVVIWLGFFPVSLLSALLLLPHLDGLSVVPRTVVSTLCLTPVMVFLVLPRITRALDWWLAGRPAPWRR